MCVCLVDCKRRGGVEPISPEINANPNHLGALRLSPLCAFSGSVFSSTLTFVGSASLLCEKMDGPERLVNFCKGAQRRWHNFALKSNPASYTASPSKLGALWGSPASDAALGVIQPGHRPREGTVGSTREKSDSGLPVPTRKGSGSGSFWLVCAWKGWGRSRVEEEVKWG